MEFIFKEITTLVVIFALAAVAGSLIERVGIVNLSIEGFMILGAISYAVLSTKTSGEVNQFWIMPMAAILTSGFAMIHCFIIIKLKAHQVIAGIAFNILAYVIALYIIKSDLNPVSKINIIDLHERFFYFKSSIFNVALMLGIPSIIFIIFLLNKTKFGIKLKACGEQPHAAASLGINVEKIQFIAITISAIFCGLAGSLFVQRKITFNGSIHGVGFLAVALVIFGQWRPTKILLGAILFGTIYALSSIIDVIPFMSQMNENIVNITPYLISIFALVLTQKRSVNPKFLGIPYRKRGS